MIWRASAELFFREAVKSLSRNKLRSTLAAIAIMIGIGAVVCVVAIGRAGSNRAEEQLQNLGENFVWIGAGSRAPSGVRTGSHGTTRLTLGDAEAIARQPLIKRVTPNVDGHAHVVWGNRNWHTHWRGIGVAWFDIKRWDVSAGAHFL
ncbi:MAG TPA: ABC transporter permease, partial [Myxococcales bacterium]